MIEMVNTILGPTPRVALDRVETVVEDSPASRCVQVQWALRTTGQVVRRDGYVDIRRPEAAAAQAGRATAGG